MPTSDLSRLRSAWMRAIDAWGAARCADWHPAKAQHVAEALDAVRRARRAYDVAWIKHHAPDYYRANMMGA